MKTLTRSLALVLSLFVTAALLAQEADVTVTKSVPAESAADTDVAFDVAVTNLGPDAAADVTINDSIPPGMTFVSATQNDGPSFNCTSLPNPGDTIGTITCTALLLASGETANFTFVFHIPAGTPGGEFFTNVATVSSPTDINEENNTASATTMTPLDPQADVSVTKTGPSAATPDDDVVFTIVVANNGPDDATDVALTDILPLGEMTFVSLNQDSGPTFSCTTPAVGATGTITCTLAAFPAGAPATFTLTTHIPPSATVGNVFQNTATVEAANDTNEENNSSTSTLVIAEADIAVAKSGPANANAGDQISYTITVSNLGPDAAIVTLSDPLPPNTTFVSLTQNNGPTATCDTPLPGNTGTVVCDFSAGMPSQASAEFTLTIEIGDAAPSITNTATVAATNSVDPNGNNDDASVVTTVTPSADLAVVKSGPATVTPGANITYTVTVTNNGASTAAAVSLTDTLPANTAFVSLTQASGPTFTCTTGATIDCDLASMAPLATASFFLVVRLAADTPNGSSIANTANVETTTPDPDGNNDSSTTTATAATSADVAVTKSAPATATPNTDISYPIVVTNNGPSDAQNVTLTDTVPANTTFVSMSPACTTPAVGGTGPITCNLGTLAPADPVTYTLVVHVVPGTPDGTVITNTANVDSTTTDPVAGNDSDTASTTIDSTADLTVTKTGPANASTNTNLIYNVTVTNNGPAEALTVTLTDVVPPDTTFVSATQTSGPTFTCTTPAVGGTGTIECTIATLAANTTATFDFVVRVDADATGTIQNTATVSSPSDPTPGNNASTTAAAVGLAGIPTLSTWALALLALSLAGIVLVRSR